MTTEFLSQLGISEDIAQKVLAEAGRDIEKHKRESATLSEQLTAAQNSLKEANTEIENFKKLDIEGVKKAADEWKIKAEETERNAAERISEMEYDAALKDALRGEAFTSEYARAGVIGEIKSKKLPLKDGAVIGLSETLKQLRDTKPDAFAQVQTKLPATAILGGDGKAPFVENKPIKEMTYEELCALPPGFSRQNERMI